MLHSDFSLNIDHGANSNVILSEARRWTRQNAKTRECEHYRSNINRTLATNVEASFLFNNTVDLLIMHMVTVHKSNIALHFS